ncbi:hypothetical protein ACJX0J_012758 [Zea mays]
MEEIIDQSDTDVFKGFMTRNHLQEKSLIYMDIIPRRAIIISIDNPVKGASGQALQNLNLMMGLSMETNFFIAWYNNDNDNLAVQWYGAFFIVFNCTLRGLECLLFGVQGRAEQTTT